MPQDFIHVKGAREHNLKNIEITVPRDKLVVITGVSGSGKSSLAFDTIYAEGQRRYVESLSAYARQFLGRMDKPDVDYIEGLSPAISIDQKGVSHNPRSTVGTVTEIYDYLRLLFARVGVPHCPKCDSPVARQTVSQIVDAIMSLEEGSRITLLAPKVRRKKGEHKDVFEAARKSGFVRIRVNGEIRMLDEIDNLNLNKNKWHYIELVVDRLIVRAETELARVAESVETCLREGEGVVEVLRESSEGGESETLVFSEQFACAKCNVSLPEIEPRTFSFNSPHGACSECTGLGYKLAVDPELVIPNKNLSLSQGAITPWVRVGTSGAWYISLMESVAEANGFSAKVPVQELDPEHVDLILYGNGSQKVTVSHRTHRGRTYSWDTNFEGVIANLERRYKTTESDYSRSQIERYMSARPCRSCGGKRLRPEALAVRVCGLGIMDVCAKNIGAAAEWVEQIDPDSEYNLNGNGGRPHPNPPPEGEGMEVLGSAPPFIPPHDGGDTGGAGRRNGSRNGRGRKSASKNGAAAPQVLSTRGKTIANQVLKEIDGRLKFLMGIGLDYVTMDRTAQTLSGGEAQRVRLATQIGSGLTGVLYVCDEPTVGLHPHDDQRLINTLTRLRDMGNTVLVVEHDEAMMRSADFIADLGPRAGEHGGQVVATGTVEEIENSPESLTGQYLSGRKQVPMPEKRREGNGLSLTITGARENNLRGIDVEFPLGRLVCITGVSGSGKSSLVYEILYKKLNQRINNGRDLPGKHDDLLGVEGVDKVVKIDQSPYRAHPAQQPGHLHRRLYSRPRAVRQPAGIAGARLQAGPVLLQRQGRTLRGLPGRGLQPNRDAVPSRRHRPLRDLPRPALQPRGAGSHHAGQAHRRRAEHDGGHRAGVLHQLPAHPPQAGDHARRGPGLHSPGPAGDHPFRRRGPARQAVHRAVQAGHGQDGLPAGRADHRPVLRGLRRLLGVLHRLVDAGNTVILIEHNIDVMKNADWLIDLGPGAGDKGGELIATGTPEELAEHPASVTAPYLKAALEQSRAFAAQRPAAQGVEFAGVAVE